MPIVVPCPDLVCENENDLFLNRIFATNPFTFVVSCPPGFFCFVNQQNFTERPPPVRQPPPVNGTITLKLQGCISLITRVLPDTATAAQIAAAAASMQAEWAAQQAMCDFTGGGGGGQPPAPAPRPISGISIDICGHPPTACVGTNYSASIFPCGSNPVGAFTYSLIAGSLPPGITTFQVFNSRNLFFTGVPTTPGRYVFVIRMTDAFSHLAQRQFVIGVIGFTSGTPPDPQVGQPYNFTFTVTGGTAPYTFTIGSGSLPDGLTLSPDGILSGIPTSGGQVSTFTVCVTDSF